MFLKLINLDSKIMLKIKLKKLKKWAGKNSSGQIVVRHRGGGNKIRFRQINFKLNQNLIGIVFSIEYDPNRNANISAVFDLRSSKFSYTIAIKNLVIGSIVKYGFHGEKKIGHTLTLRKIPVGCCVCNITLNSSCEAKLIRSAGNYAIITKKTQTSAIVLLSSGKSKVLPLYCFATVGIISNEFYYLTQSQKAGKSRWLNKRPTVRGVAQNPTDHPNGGGEGKKSGKRASPWGKILPSPK
jgi:large subunit ribosomal protein L2